MSICRLLAAAAACFVVGCADFRGYCDSQLLASRNHYLAQLAFNNRGVELCESRKHLKDFRKGFHAGYYHVAAGNGGVAPLVPPDEYWAACYQDADGHEMINDWFAGFNEGSFAAAQDGVGELAELPTWVGGACCDENDRIMARREIGPRKPRRGDPPVRATLPPPMPKTDPPKNSEGKSGSPVDPTIEMPLPSETELKERDDSALPKDAPKDAPAKKTSAKEAATQKRTWMKAAPIVENKPETKPQAAPPANRWARREPTRATPVKSSMPQKDSAAAMPQMTPRIGKAKQPDFEARIPVNPFLKSKPEPSFPVAPPVLPSVGIKAAPIVEQPAPKSPTVENASGEPPPPAPAKPLERMEAKRTLLDSKLQPASHTVEPPQANSMERSEPQRPFLTTPQNDLWRQNEPTAPAKQTAAKERKLEAWDSIVERKPRATDVRPKASATERVEPPQPSSPIKQQETWVQSEQAPVKLTEQTAAKRSLIPQKPVENAVERQTPVSSPESPPVGAEDEWGTPHDKSKRGTQ